MSKIKTKPPENKFEIYIDGACSGNPGPGGWGVLFYYMGSEEWCHGGSKKTTNNQMELMAAIKALELLPVQKDIPVVIYCDSQYVINGITKWVSGWKKKGWKTSTNSAVKNKELWERLVKLVSKHHKLEWQWVKGHSGNYGNDKADELSKLGMLALSMQK
jgi:ribonuclease HI